MTDSASVFEAREAYAEWPSVSWQGVAKREFAGRGRVPVAWSEASRKVRRGQVCENDLREVRRSLETRAQGWR